MNNIRFDDYPFQITPLSEEDGGGYLITFPDLPGCMSDGETPEEAVAMGRDAFQCWIDTCQAEGRSIPTPGSGGVSGKFNLRTPKSLHAKLIQRAQIEGVSMNTLAIALLAEALGCKHA